MTVLKRIFAQEEPLKQTCTVLGRMYPGRYKLRDQLGRIVQADSDMDWRPGETVTVQQGRIVGRADGKLPERVEV